MTIIKKTTVLVLLILLVFTASPAHAEDMVYKLSRGLTNLITGWGELAVQLVASQQDHNAVTGTFAGLFRGLYFTVARELTGVYDVVTFPIPLPANYEPLWKPATVFEAWQEIIASTGKQ